MRLDEAKRVLIDAGYLVEKIDPNGGPTYRTREGIVTNRPNKPTSSNIPQHMISYLSKKSDICDDIIKGLNELIEYISDNGDDDDGRLAYIIKELVALRNKGNIPMPK